MYEKQKCECPFCNSKATSQLLTDGEYHIIDCPLCGKFIIDLFNEDNKLKNHLSFFLFYNKKENKDFNFIGEDKYFNILQKKFSSSIIYKITPEILNTIQIMSFSDKINSLIVYLANKSNYIGDTIRISLNEFVSAAFIYRFSKNGEKYNEIDIKRQVNTLAEYLNKSDLLKEYTILDKYLFLELSIKGWQLIEELQKNNSFVKKVFIAMSYAPETTLTREAIKLGITKAGYTPILIDEVTHNHQIVPEMFKQIRDSKFLVIDVTVPNNGAYYEAGYALGLGKEVIFCCKKETFDDETKRPHFDVSQKQMIVWEDDKELSDKLEKWIKSLFE